MGYRYYNPNPSGRMVGDCVIRAISKATNRSWEEIYVKVAIQAMNSADLKYTIATEACADRAAVTDALRAVNDNVDAKAQMIIDKMCQSELDAERRENANLRSQIQLMQLTSTQDNQTQTLLAGQNAGVASILAGQAQRAAEVEQYVNPTAVPAYIVQNPNCCTPQYGTGCGC